MPEALTAQRYVELLEGHRSPEELEKIRLIFGLYLTLYHREAIHPDISLLFHKLTLIL